MKKWNDYKVCLGLCNNQDKINSAFFWNFQTILKPTNYIAIRGQASIKSASLNSIVKEAWRWKVDKILFMDVDMEFPFDVLPKLLSRNLPIVSGLYHLKKPPHSPVAGWSRFSKKEQQCVNDKGQMWKEGYSPFPTNENNLVEVDWVGIGCLLVDMDVFEHIKFPCFYDEWNWELGERQKGHDILFCEAVKKAGYKVYVDTLVQCEHVGQLSVSDLWVEAYHSSGMPKKELEVVKERARSKQYWDEVHFEDRMKGRARRYPKEWQYVMDQIPIGSSVGEVGCGLGHLMAMLQEKRSCDCYGYDLSAVAIDEVKRRGFDAEVADFRTYKPNGKAFDVVVASHVLEHMVDDVGFLKRLSAMMNGKKSKVIVSVPDSNIGRVSDLEHYQVYTKQSLRDTMNKVFNRVTVKKIDRFYVATGSQPHGR